MMGVDASRSYPSFPFPSVWKRIWSSKQFDEANAELVAAAGGGITTDPALVGTYIARGHDRVGWKDSKAEFQLLSNRGDVMVETLLSWKADSAHPVKGRHA